MAGPTAKAERSEGEGLEALNPNTLLYLEIQMIRGPRLTGVKGSDLISLLLQILKGLMTTYRRSGSFSLPANGRGHQRVTKNLQPVAKKYTLNSLNIA